MSVLIKGMEMPVFEHQSWDIRHGADGKWYIVDTNAETSDGEWHEIVSIPPHSDLIERNALEKRIKAEGRNQAEQLATRFDPVVRAYGDCYGMVKNAPTIIEAEEG